MPTHRSPRSGFYARSIAGTVIVALLVAVGFLTYLGLDRSAAASRAVGGASAGGSSALTMFHRPHTLLVVGDSFAGGTGDPRFVTYPRLVADQMGWSLAVDAQGGTGFVTGHDSPGFKGVPFIDRLALDAATYSVDYVLIDGGRNDLGTYPGPVAAAIDTYLQQVRSYWPKAKLVVMTPSYATDKVASNYQVLAEAIMKSAARVDAKVIDPVAEGWYRGIDIAPLLWDDGVHLNGPGNQYYAARVVENLKRLGYGQ